MLERKLNPYFTHHGLKTILYCPVCSTHYNSLCTRILEEKENTHLIHMECLKCGTSVVALVMLEGVGLNSVGLITDLTSQDVLKFKNSEFITLDDVIDLHLLLKNDINFFKTL